MTSIQKNKTLLNIVINERHSFILTHVKCSERICVCRRVLYMWVRADERLKFHFDASPISLFYSPTGRNFFWG